MEKLLVLLELYICGLPQRGYRVHLRSQGIIQDLGYLIDLYLCIDYCGSLHCQDFLSQGEPIAQKAQQEITTKHVVLDTEIAQH